MAAGGNLATYLDVWDRIINHDERELFDTYFAHDYEFHSPTVSLKGPAEAREYYGALLDAFSNREFTSDDAFEAEGGRIAKRWTFRGTHTADLKGIAATHKQVTLVGVTLARMVDGRIVEERDFMDELGMLQQLGVIPSLSD